MRCSAKIKMEKIYSDEFGEFSNELRRVSDKFFRMVLCVSVVVALLTLCGSCSYVTRRLPRVHSRPRDSARLGARFGGVVEILAQGEGGREDGFFNFLKRNIQSVSTRHDGHI